MSAVPGASSPTLSKTRAQTARRTRTHEASRRPRRSLCASVWRGGTTRVVQAATDSLYCTRYYRRRCWYRRYYARPFDEYGCADTCPSNTYRADDESKPGGSVCLDCEDYAALTTSPSGSDGKESCTCRGGTHTTHSPRLACHKCPVKTYVAGGCCAGRVGPCRVVTHSCCGSCRWAAAGDTKCTHCPSRSSTDAGDYISSADACKCDDTWFPRGKCSVKCSWWKDCAEHGYCSDALIAKELGPQCTCRDAWTHHGSQQCAACARTSHRCRTMAEENCDWQDVLHVHVNIDGRTFLCVVGG